MHSEHTSGARCFQTIVPTRDGIRLNTFVFLPEVGGPRYPVILHRTPYGITSPDAQSMTDGTRAWLPSATEPWRGSILRGWRSLVAHGYAAFYQDTRGRYGSEGEDHVYGDDAEDGYDSLEWIANQPWTNQMVGMSGSSAGATTTFAAASQRHPSLRTAPGDRGGSPILTDGYAPMLALHRGMLRRVDRGQRLDPRIVETERHLGREWAVMVLQRSDLLGFLRGAHLGALLLTPHRVQGDCGPRAGQHGQPLGPGGHGIGLVIHCDLPEHETRAVGTRRSPWCWPLALPPAPRHAAVVGRQTPRDRHRRARSAAVPDIQHGVSASGSKRATTRRNVSGPGRPWGQAQPSAPPLPAHTAMTSRASNAWR